MLKYVVDLTNEIINMDTRGNEEHISAAFLHDV